MNNKVRTRFAPSPTGYMHIGGLRTALYTYLIAKKNGGTFILRIEDTDTARYVEGATGVIIKTLKDAGLNYDEGPDVGGSYGPYVQSERKDLYKPYAVELCEKGAAYYCFCSVKSDDLPQEKSNDCSVTSTDVPHEKPNSFSHVSCSCRDLKYEDSKKRADAGESYAIRMKAPKEGETKVTDVVFGEVIVQNKELDDMVLLKRDLMPTYNFANVVDDHLMGITHVMRGSEYISSAPKYNLLYQAFDWEIPVYITVSPIMRDATHKLSKRDGDPTYDDLLNDGYLPDAVLNYIALLGWSPGGENEFFTLSQLLEVFDVSGISKSPAIFDIEKLNHFNSEYIRKMTPEEFETIAEPYIRKVIKNENLSIPAISRILQARCIKLSEIPEKIDFFESLPDYDPELFVHQKSKTDKMIALEMLFKAKDIFEKLPEWTNDSIHDILIETAEKLNIKNATLMWPVRIATAGKAVTPGGAVEICSILGRKETLCRIELGIKKLQGDN